jgi:arylsulfate sulfotransferase
LKTVSVRRLFVAGGLIAGCAALSATAMATPIVAVPATSLNPPQPLGTTITITASATDTDPGVISYRFEIGAAGSANLGMGRDYSVDPTFVFTPVEHEGKYQFVVTARNNSTGNTGTSKYSPFAFTSLVTGATPVITPTVHPLVALFSSPPCSAGGLYMRVSILRSGAASPSYTNWKPCTAGLNLNFVVAGMRATSLYYLNSQTWNGSTVTSGTALRFTTGTPRITFPEISVTTPFTSEDSSVEHFMLMAYAAGFPMAVDLSASPVWYYVDPSGVTPLVTRPVSGGEILMIAYGANSAGTTTNLQQILREIDLEGNIIRETNATRVSEQLVAMSGIASSCQIGGTECLGGAFTHEAVQLPNGHTLTMLDEEKIFTDGTQGSSPANPVDIIGDIIVDLDTNWQVAWYWRAFDYLNANRAAILGETCTPGQIGCPPVLLTAGVAQDWLHGNALYYTSADGSILYSMRHQDWIVKIDYGNGTGTNNILWTLGLGGDFTINSTDPYPWFSHQHDPGFVQNGTTVMAMFDNGNTRVAPPPLGLGSGDSRGYVLNVDQTNMVVTPTLLADLGFFSQALGSAELLSNGDYHFEAGDGPTSPPYSDAIEVFPNATLGFTMLTSNNPCYRNFRMASLYTPPGKD